MGIDASPSDYDWHAALAALAWQIDLGVTEFSTDSPIDRYDLPDRLEPVVRPKPVAAIAPAAPRIDTTAQAETTAAACADLPGLKAALADFPHCELKRGARNLVFADGNPAAPLMVVGGAPDREEDLQGRPFIGSTGQLLDNMLAAIGHARAAEDSARAAYLINAIPWRPPGDSEPADDDIAMLRPFLLRHIALVKPRVLIAFGSTACAALLGEASLQRLRGTWTEVAGIPVMPMTHPANLLRHAAAKRTAWQDLLAIQERLGNEYVSG